MTLELAQHPLSAAFPSMSDDDYAALKDDIDDYGQREPIILFEGQVLDGWHRYLACIDLGIKPTQFNFDANEDPVAFVKSENLHRRHLTASQRAAAVVALYGWVPAGRPKDKGATLPIYQKVPALSDAAQASQRTVKDAITAEKGGLLGAVKDGALSASQAAAIVRGTAARPPAKPKAKPAPTIDPAIVDQLADTQEAVKVLSEENDVLNDRLAVVAMDATAEERSAATDTISELRAKIKTLEIELRAVKASRDGYMRENGEMKNQLAGYKRQLAKLQATPPALNGDSSRVNHATTRRPN